MIDIKLLPCPFCGGTNIVHTDASYGKANTHCIYCEDCGGGTANFSGCASYDTLKRCAAKFWNRRPTPKEEEKNEI